MDNNDLVNPKACHWDSASLLERLCRQLVHGCSWSVLWDLQLATSHAVDNVLEMQERLPNHSVVVVMAASVETVHVGAVKQASDQPVEHEAPGEHAEVLVHGAQSGGPHNVVGGVWVVESTVDKHLAAVRVPRRPGLKVKLGDVTVDQRPARVTSDVNRGLNACDVLVQTVLDMAVETHYDLMRVNLPARSLLEEAVRGADNCQRALPYQIGELINSGKPLPERFCVQLAHHEAIGVRI
mmetsp:Transcript_3711/g.9854  ORF Transcript_3711/g.9854 Transcript_3711/m.9854 type:complete len:239 (-) Transcript_3711:115-831(-)